MPVQHPDGLGGRPACLRGPLPPQSYTARKITALTANLASLLRHGSRHQGQQCFYGPAQRPLRLRVGRRQRGVDGVRHGAKHLCVRQASCVPIDLG
ncbi:hypothetical protein ABT124_47170 [Streptomyces sp. NPDC001982]|uniref:hypothetical protein n=1 Tax=Streptomyces sp. NPDC001982 TaxID=3154405 RepID=UPI003322FBC1